MSTDTSPKGAREGLLAAARAELDEHGHAAISLRAIARRAGVSHALPKYHFGDRAGLLTAIATDGFQALGKALHEVATTADPPPTDPRQRVAALGRTYTLFGLTHPALFDLMFRPTELHPDDPALVRAQHEAISVLSAAVADLAPADPSTSATPILALISWAFVHGLVVLTRDGALHTATNTQGPEAATALADTLTDIFCAHLLSPATT
jgi:AcrR family transcriptional regulator